MPQDGKSRFNDVPDKLIVNVSISVDQNVSEGDYLLIVRDPASQLLINLRKLAKRFPDYLELPFNARLQQCTLEVIVERLSGYELRNEI